MYLRPFQKRFIRAATAPQYDTACLSLARGNGKSWLAGHLVSRVMDADDPLFRAGTESVLCAASIEQARIVFRFARETLEPRGGYRFLDSHTRIGITHEKTNTKLRVIGSNGRTAMGLVGCPWAICDEPGAWEVNGGTLLHDAIETAKGKPGSPLRVIYIGTLAPATGGWWHDLVKDGTHGSVYVQALRGDPKKWDKWNEIRRCNPLVSVDENFRKKLLQERDEARKDSRLKARFLSYRLNIPTGDESEMLLTVEDYESICARPVAERSGRPVVGIDLGGGRAWSAAAALWETGRIEVCAVAPGIPDLEAQERRDRVPRGIYRKLYEEGSLQISEGLRVQPPAQLVEFVHERWGAPEAILCDRFRVNELRDCVNGTPIVDRVTRWSEAAADIRALRRGAKDGPFSCPASSRKMLAASLSAARVENDKQGSFRLIKRGQNNEARDDVAAALVLASGAYEKLVKSRKSTGVYLGMV